MIFWALLFGSLGFALASFIVDEPVWLGVACLLGAAALVWSVMEARRERNG